MKIFGDHIVTSLDTIKNVVQEPTCKEHGQSISLIVIIPFAAL